MGVPILNLIREVILMDESELYDAFTEKERKEFLFRIFSHIVFGGASNQYEDHVEEYFKVTKEVYKALLTVRRNDAGDVEVLSTVADCISRRGRCPVSEGESTELLFTHSRSAYATCAVL